MMPTPNLRLVRSLKSFSPIAGVSSLLVGCLVLLGWLLDIAALKSVLPGLVTMKANTALAFLLAGVCLLLLGPGPTERGHKPWRRRPGQAGAGVIALLGLLTLSQYVFGWNLGIDERFFRDVVGAIGTSQPGRMAPATAVNFFLLGCALLLLDVQGRRGHRPAEYLALVSACLGFLASLGYAYGIRSLYGFASYTEMALHTALTFLLFSAGLLCARPDRGLMAIVTSQGAGGVLARRLLPAVIGIPVLLGWLRLEGQRAGLYETELGVALVAVSSIIGFTAVIYLYAKSLDRADGARKQAEDALRTAHDELEVRVQERTAALVGANEALQREVAERKRAEETTHRQSTLLEAINRVLVEALTCETDEEVARTCLAVSEELTGSKFGRIDELNEAGRVDTIALSNPGWEACKIPLAEATRLLKNVEVRSYWGRVFKTGESQIVNDPASDRDRLGIPEGHPPITSFLGVPLKHAGRTIGMIGLANKESGYTLADQQAVEALSVAFVEALFRKRAEREVRKLNEDLERRVLERTGELAGANQALQTQIAERVRAQEDLDHYFTLSLDLLCIAGFDGYFKRINPAWEGVLGFAREELLARPYLDLVHPDDREATVTEAQKLTTGKDTVSFENRYLSKDGRYRWLSWKSTPSPGRELIYAAARDVTERKQAEEEIRKLNEDLERHAAELAAANKELEAFTYSVSHDLRAPLRQIDGFSKLLVEEHGQGLSAEARHYLERVSEGTRQMGQLVDDLLNLARVGRQEVRRQVTGLNSLVGEVLKNLIGEMSDRPIEFEIGQLPFVECDPALMKQVFANLLSNALKFTRPRKQALIEVDQATMDGQPVVFVRDNGVGFSMKYVDKLFGVFQRLHRVEDFEGTGVGLATVQRIIQKHGGRVWAEAELDKGATFYFTLGSAENNTREIGERENDARVVAGGER